MAEAEEQLKKLELEKAYQTAESASIKEKMKETEGAREKELKKLRELSTPEGALIQESEGDEVSVHMQRASCCWYSLIR